MPEQAPALQARRFLVSGRVQGVCFRAATRERALELGIRGSARNLADGRVEVIAGGEARSLDALAEWLRRGPPLAEVEAVHSEPWTAAVGDGFRTG